MPRQTIVVAVRLAKDDQARLRALREQTGAPTNSAVLKELLRRGEAKQAPKPPRESDKEPEG
jgi:predicted DNA-binding protein